MLQNNVVEAAYATASLFTSSRFFARWKTCPLVNLVVSYLKQVYLQKQLELGLDKFTEKYGLVPIAGVETDGMELRKAFPSITSFTKVVKIDENRLTK